MRALILLYLYKLKGQIRNVFSKPSSAIVTGLLLLIYVGGFVMVLMNPDQAMSMVNIDSVQIGIMIAVGFNALMIASLLMQKRSALFFENDSFYMFTGPFKRAQIMRFLMSGSILSSLMFGGISSLMLVFFGGGVGFTIPFLLLCFVLISMVTFFFVVLKDYVYLLAIQNEKLNCVGKIVVIAFALIVAGIFGYVAYEQGFDMKLAGKAFLGSDLFHLIPLFGWTKLALVAYVGGDMMMVATGALLILAACIIIYALMSRYRGDFVERAMQDAEEFTALYKDIKAGKRSSFNDQKVRGVKGEFKEGANAILSKNLLVMRKTNDFIRMQDVLILAFYLIITLVLDMGFFFYCYMLVFWVFSVVQSSDFMRDMNNYQIYLIPDSPLKKLWNVIAATLLKLWITLIVCIIISGLIFHMGLYDILQYLVMICGYAFVFIAATVLSLRLLKSRSNMMVENMLRMLIIFLCSLPSILVILPIIMATGTLTMQMMNIVTIVNLVANFVVSFAILFFCKGMMNGRELKSE